MTRALSFTLIVLSLLVLGAHFMRSGLGVFVALALLLVLLLPVRRRWVARTVQLVLVLGSLEWVRTLVQLAMWRNQHGEPFLRMVLILGAVAAVTLGSAMLFQTPSFKRIYGLQREGTLGAEKE
jgi:hypothetical protein